MDSRRSAYVPLRIHLDAPQGSQGLAANPTPYPSPACTPDTEPLGPGAGFAGRRGAPAQPGGWPAAAVPAAGSGRGGDGACVERTAPCLLPERSQACLHVKRAGWLIHLRTLPWYLGAVLKVALLRNRDYCTSSMQQGAQDPVNPA